MKHSTLRSGAALSTLALAIAAGSAWAATDATVPAKNAPAKTHHAAKTGPAAKPATPSHEAVGQVWDWSKIDLNKDNEVTPEEMQAWLNANPGVQKGE